MASNVMSEKGEITGNDTGDHAGRLQSALQNEQRTSNASSSTNVPTSEVESDAIQPKRSQHAHWNEDAPVTTDLAEARRSSSKESKEEKLERLTADGKVILQEEDAWSEIGFCFPSIKKWYILSVIFMVQVSMNFNTSLYSNATTGISEEFGVSLQGARCGAMIFLILYAFGCELWAPWSEEIGRWPVLQASLLLVNIWQIPVALAPNFTTIMVGRALGGLSSAGGSVTLGMIADMWESDTQQYAVAFVVFSSVGGSVLGPVVGGFVEANLNWRWCIWIQLIFGGFVQILHAATVPETRTTIMLDRIAKKRRAAGGDPNIYGPNELLSYSDRFSARELAAYWYRPFKMFLTEPIVLTLSLLSGFSDALIFMFIQSFSIVYKQWGFTTVDIGLSFLPILVGYFIAWAAFIPAIKRNIAQRRARPDDERAQYESRLWLLLWAAPCLPIGLIGFAWTSGGPPIHWIGSSVFAAIVGIANYSIYMATIDYMICAYGPYSASATGGNGWSRDFLAGVLTIPATPFFSNIGSRPLQNASTILFCISFVLVLAVYAVYYYGPTLRARSKFAQQLSQAGKAGVGRRRAEAEGAGRANREKPSVGSRTTSYARRHQEERVREATGSRRNTPHGTPSQSRRNSMTIV